MFIDSLLEFCDGVELSGGGSAIAEAKGTVLDLNATSDLTEHDLGSGEPIYLVMNVTAAFTGGTNVKIDLRSSPNQSLETTFETHWTTATIVQANYGDLTGMTIVPLPAHPFKYGRYVGIHVTTSGAVDGGTADIFLTKDVSKWFGTATRVPATDPAN